MRVFFDKQGKIVHRETDRMDIWTKRYTIRISIGGITIIRNARPKKNKPAITIYNEYFNLTG
jgi:hypothetical protein